MVSPFIKKTDRGNGEFWGSYYLYPVARNTYNLSLYLWLIKCKIELNLLQLWVKRGTKFWLMLKK